MENIIFNDLHEPGGLLPQIQTSLNTSDLFLINSGAQDLVTVSIKSEGFSTCDSNNRVHVSVLSFDDSGSPYISRQSHGKGKQNNFDKHDTALEKLSKIDENLSPEIANIIDNEVFECIEAVIRRDICQVLSAASESDWLINLKYLQGDQANIRESENGQIIITGSLSDITKAQKIISGYIKDLEKAKNTAENSEEASLEFINEQYTDKCVDYSHINTNECDKEKYMYSKNCENLNKEPFAVESISKSASKYESVNARSLFRTKQRTALEKELVIKSSGIENVKRNISVGNVKKSPCKSSNHKIPSAKLLKKNVSAYKCSQCSYVTHCLSSLNFHKKTHRRSSKATILSNQSELSLSKISQSKLRCDICGIEMGSREYKTHVNKFHPIKHECSDCPYSTTSKVHFIRHRKTIHENHRPHECEICGKAFKRQDHMKLHQVIHYRDQKGFVAPKSIFKCEICKKIVRSAAYLKEHMLTHSPSRSFLCEICGSAFKTRATHRGHIRSMHLNVQRNPCLKCGKQFASMASLRRHMLQHQKRSNFSNLDKLSAQQVGSLGEDISSTVKNQSCNEKGWNNLLPDMNFLAPVNQLSSVDESIQSNDTSIESSADSQGYFH